LARAVHAVEALDGDRLERELSEAAVDLPTPQLLERVLAPLLRSIGDGWREGRIRPSHEHLTTAVVRSFLGVIALRRDSAGTGGELVVATPAGQLHELGALMAAVAAVLDGWRVTYLGPNLAADEIALAARQRGARAVALSVIYAGDPNRIEAELRELRRLIGADIGLFVGGAGLAAVTGALAEVGALRIDSIDSFRRVLERLRGKTT
ncbi:MAG TPA: cobalamin-dependent protein, partial [Candidatus Polarisedimenticolaceae bacterium]|nr:cobalamin-dependent protein [Candidatus Polarisedimenticolaceae bacterium]